MKYEFPMTCGRGCSVGCGVEGLSPRLDGFCDFRPHYLKNPLRNIDFWVEISWYSTKIRALNVTCAPCFVLGLKNAEK